MRPLAALLVFLWSSPGLSQEAIGPDPAPAVERLEASATALHAVTDSLRGVLDSLQQKRDSAWRSDYTVTLGPTFDLLDGLSATDLFAEVRIFRPDLWPIGGGRAIGLDAGLIRGRTITADDTTALPDLTTTYFDAGADSVVIARTAGGSRQRQSRVDYLSLYADLTVTLVPGPRRLYGIVHGEVRSEDLLHSITTTGRTVTIEVTRDTSRAERPRQLASAPSAGPIDEVTRRTRSSSAFGYFGAGLLFEDRDDSAGVRYRLKAVGGALDDGRGFYLLQFDLAERTSGFRFGGEIVGVQSRGRGRALAADDGLLPEFDAPRVTVYLSKTFSLQRLAKFIGT